MNRSFATSAVVLAFLLLAGCGQPDGGDEAGSDATGTDTSAAPAEAPAEANVTTERMLAGDNPGQWMAHGRTYSEQRFSPLDQVNTDTVQDLGLAWHADFDTNQTQESTPLVIDGTVYVTTAWSKVYAFDGKTGALKWKYDPEVPGEWAVKLCCGVVNRGLAAWNGKLYLGTLDARLIAIDAESGEEVWSSYTADTSQSYSITGAPRAAKGLVFIGNGGAEFLMRGYISAYDTETGELVWRWYTVPGDPSRPQEDEALERAVETWDPAGEWWKVGGGGTPWDGITYDPVTDFVYVGTGNGGPWPSGIRSPEGGSNLYTNSIVALDADTGEYVWHYQTTPEDSWDYDGTQQMMIADLEIDGEMRHVIMQAPKNGFFYVLDAKTGELLSADPYVTVNWASHIDLETGYPAFNPEAHYGRTDKGFIVQPPSGGAHSWHPMAMSPETGYVYIPTVDGTFPLVAMEGDDNPMGQKLSISFRESFALYEKRGVEPINETYITAWDPVAKKTAWQYDLEGIRGGGILATAGGVLFQGNSRNEFAAYDAATGEQLWTSDVQTGVVAGPATYSIDGEQYVAVVTGGRAGGGRPDAYYLSNHSRITVYKLGGTAELPPEPPMPEPPVLDPPPLEASAEVVEHGGQVYDRFCSVCHGTDGQTRGLFPDIRYSSALHAQADFNAIVLEGIRSDEGMVAFADALDEQDAAALRSYVVSIAHEAKNAPPPGGPPPADGDDGEETGEEDGGLHGD